MKLALTVMKVSSAVADRVIIFAPTMLAVLSAVAKVGIVCRVTESTAWVSVAYGH